jgi:uncharacterized RDD family membrane protein YckC
MSFPETQMQHQPGKADLGKRIVAAVIDGVLCAVVAWIPFIGGIVAAAYVLVRDGLELEFADRRSIGKKVMKLRPVRLDGQPMDIGTSVKRNLIFVVGAVGAIFAIIPILGWIIAILLGIAALVLGAVELALIVTDPEGRRMGDKMAGTKVVETME